MKVVEKVVPAKPARTVIKFQCERCGTIYRYKSQARKCETMEVETLTFKVGDLVIFSDHLIPCSKTWEYHQATGTVFKITGPDHDQPDINADNIHHYKYFVEYVCPFCRIKFQTYARASSMKLLFRKIGSD